MHRSRSLIRQEAWLLQVVYLCSVKTSERGEQYYFQLNDLLGRDRFNPTDRYPMSYGYRQVKEAFSVLKQDGSFLAISQGLPPPCYRSIDGLDDDGNALINYLLEILNAYPEGKEKLSFENFVVTTLDEWGVMCDVKELLEKTAPLSLTSLLGYGRVLKLFVAALAGEIDNEAQHYKQ